MASSPVSVHLGLAGWELCWILLSDRGAEAETAVKLRRLTEVHVRNHFALDGLASDPVIAALRRLFRQAGCDPTRYRPSSEALLRRLLKGAELPALHPLVDLNNCLSVELAVPCCVLSEGSFRFPVTLRRGEPGESFDSLRGPFRLEGKPVLADDEGPFGSPITDSRRVKITTGTQRAWLVAYLPQGVVTPEQVGERLAELLLTAPLARIEGGVGS